MKLILNREHFLKGLQTVAGVIEKRQTMPILGNVLLQVNGHHLTLTGSDLEIESRAQVAIDQVDGEAFDITLPAQKLLTIVRSLPEGISVSLDFEGQRCTLKAGRSLFKLSTLPAADYPHLDLSRVEVALQMSHTQLKQMLAQTTFAMASQDVRFYLNGMLFDVSPQALRLVATDGHRLSTAALEADFASLKPMQVIVPRKGILELAKLLLASDELVELAFAKNYLTIKLADTVFTCKLIEGRYPDFRRVIPEHNDVLVTTDRELMRATLQRAAILSNERFKGVRMVIESNLLTVHAQNTEQDESNEDMAIDYIGDKIEIGFNVSYLLDVIQAVKDEHIVLSLKDSSSSCLIATTDGLISTQHVVMPMRL
ncbi:DNA polymerase III subunit beta [Thiomicrospira sp. ALE5]|uniref:DNA polymerase III subunit beta n=1 Tax=Thiomicrospira sp. ALE5 TaxID=748650 RepID=UPI0008EA712A|nr:DNA polymerase III subunit beta [Thiomicrospira sp. ALE5]SFR56799.1 DNA polymerase-3 subunit beta [Thiomicrospira sp. ALE5]